MSEENSVDLGKLFADLQKQLAGSQELIREHVTHPGAKGDGSEFNWIEILTRYLPSRYRIERAFIVDSLGKRSEQQDIVIFDRQYTPFILRENAITYVPAESVYTVIEVKQSLNKPHIEYASRKASSVRALHRTSAPIPHAGGEYKPKSPFHIPAGILALSSDWSPPLGDAFRATVLEAAKCADSRIEFGCVLQGGAFRLKQREGSIFEIEACKAEASLMYFFLTLFHILQQLGTVVAIDVMAYAKWLECDPKTGC